MTHKLKAFGGDRAKNLLAIADGLDQLLQFGPVKMPQEDLRRALGWLEQIRIIADELAQSKPIKVRQTEGPQKGRVFEVLDVSPPHLLVRLEGTTHAGEWSHMEYYA